jgi:hypothetical protein
VKPRKAFALFLFAAGCFGLGLAVARWLGWGPAAGPPLPPGAATGLGAAGGLEPRIYIDAGEVILYDGSLSIDPPPPPHAEPR